MLLLGLDTATAKGSLALLAGGRLLAEASLESQGAYLTRLLPAVAALLEDAGHDLAELGGIGVSLGPGNFTGLRIGLATAKTLAWSLRCPLAAVPTMEVLAAQLPFQARPIGVLLDAKRQEVFWGLYRNAHDYPRTLVEPVRLPLADLPSRLQAPMLLTGPGLDAYNAFLEKTLPPGVEKAPPELRHPRAATVARLAQQRIDQGLTVPPAQLVPFYLRPAL